MGRLIYGIFERMWKPVVALCFKAFSWHSLGRIEKKPEEPQDSLCSRQYSKHASPKVLVRKVTNSANTLNKYIFTVSQFYNISGLGNVVFIWFKHWNWNINNVYDIMSFQCYSFYGIYLDCTKALDVKNVYADVKFSNVYSVNGFVKINLFWNDINTMENVYTLFQNYILIPMDLTHVLINVLIKEI